MSYAHFSPFRRLLHLAASALLLVSLSNLATAAAPQVQIITSLGNITLELNADKAPQTAANFLKYVEDKHYEGTIFHRVIKDFMIQGGGMLPDMSQKPCNAPIKNEANNGLKNDRGTIAMARTSDPHSATAQFFINTVDNDFLNFRAENTQGWGYAVFGKVVEGLDVVDQIRAVSTGRSGYHSDVPVEAVVIDKAEVV